MDPDEGPEYEKGLAAIRAALDDAPFAAAWAEGKKMNLDDAVTFALGHPQALGPFRLGSIDAIGGTSAWSGVIVK